MLYPRKYQKVVIIKSVEYLKSNSIKKPIIVAPTASGKSIMIAFITKELKKNVLVLQPTKELLLQNYEKFEMAGGKAKIYSASVNQKEIGDITFATIGSIYKKAELFKHKKYILIDECHLVAPKKDGMYQKFFKELNVKYLGLTATAFRTKPQKDIFSGEVYTKINLLPRERPKFFNHFLHIIQMKEMYKQGYLVPIKWIQLDWNNNLLIKNSTGGEYTDDSVSKALKIQKVNQRLPSLIEQALEKGRKHILVFVLNVEMAKELSLKVPNSASLSAKTKKKEREQIIKDFKSGKLKVIFNVQVLTTGFDFPALDLVILARPTRSIVLFIQMVGRVLRIAKDKEYGVVLDMTGNYGRFGDVKEIEIINHKEKGWILRNDKRILSARNLKF